MAKPRNRPDRAATDKAPADEVSFTVRLPLKVNEALEASAAECVRSKNHQIIWFIEQGLKRLARRRERRNKTG